MRQIIHSLFFFLIAVSSHATTDKVARAYKLTNPANCKEEVRLDLPPNGTMSKMPVQDQNTSNLCWSYSGTQLIDAWRSKYDPPAPPWSSPLAFGMGFLNFHGVTDEKANQSAYKFLKTAPKLKSCSYEVVNDSLIGKKRPDLFDSLRTLHQLARSGRATEAELDNQLKSCLVGMGQNKSLNWAQVSHFAQESQWQKFGDSILKEVCATHSRDLSKLPSPEKVSAYDKSEFADGIQGMFAIRDSINEMISSPSSLPVGIRFCPAVLFRTSPGTLDENGDLNAGACKNQAGRQLNMHAAVIVGKRPVMFTNSAGQTFPICQYLVRDSGGADCDAYKEPTIFNPSDRCVNGQIWVDEKTLMTNTNEAFFLPDRKF
jgi:hypothetical protein